MLTLVAVVVLGASPAVVLTPREGPPSEVSGLVQDERGKPVGGAKVTLLGGSHHRMVTKEATTGPDGRFVVSGAPRGMHGTSLSVTAEGFAPLNDLLALEGSGAFELTVRLGRPSSITGRLVAPDATGGALRLLQLAPAGTDLEKWRWQQVPVTTGTLEPSGAFTLTAPEGKYELEWTRPSGVRFFAPVSVPAKAVTLKAPGRQLEVKVLTAAGAGVPGVRVTVGRDGTPESFASGTTDARGVFGVRGLDEGDYRVEFMLEQSCRARPVTVRGESTRLALTLNTGWTLSGQVVDVEGKGLPNIDVLLEPTEKAEGLCGTMTAVRRTDAEGRFTVSDLQSDELVVSASAGRRGDLQPVQLTVKKGAPVTLTLRKGVQRTVTGVVLGPDRQPISGAMVGPRRDFTDASGRFTVTLESRDPPRIEVYRRCFVRKEVPEAEAATVVMERRPCLSANVVNAARQPVSGMHPLTLKRADGSRVSDCNTREKEGDCTLEAELGELTLEGPGGARTTVKVTGVEKTEVYLEVK